MEQLIMSKYSGNARVVRPVRNQMQMSLVSLDQLVPEDHKVRLVWKYVEKLDLNQFFIEIDSMEGNRGRPAIDPRVLLALWLYATIEGICHGRVYWCFNKITTDFVKNLP